MAAAAAAAYPPWVMLERYCTVEVDGCSSSIADMNTLASCLTTSGHPINVSLCLAAPPEGSRVCVQLPAGVEASAQVLAAHGDSVVVQIIQVTRINDDRPLLGYGHGSVSFSADHFVYNAGDAAAEPPRLPSLLRLAPLPYEEEETRCRPRGRDYKLESHSTGLLRRGEHDFVVAELKTEYVTERGATTREEAALRLLRSSSGEWCVKRPVVRRYGGGGGGETTKLAPSWPIVIPVGDRMLCWVDLTGRGGLLISDDVFDGESPSLGYVPFPEDPKPDLGSRSVGATADGSTVKFVHVFPRCCCGAAGSCCCAASLHAYAVHTWTLRMDDGGMTWAMDARLDATQLWCLDGYAGLPRRQLSIPVVSLGLDEPDAICFMVYGEEPAATKWWIMVDMRSKTLRSVFRYPEERHASSSGLPLPSKVSRYFDSRPSTGHQQPGPSAAQAEEAVMDLTNIRVGNDQLHAINTVQAASASLEAAILAALQAIPGLDRDDLLKTYRILAHDNSGCRFRALMGLPMDFRKDCVLMEIKASEACILCSVCSADLQLNKSLKE